MEDREIIELYFERSQRAVAETREKYGGVIRGCLGNILSDRSDAEECENDTYMGAWSSIPPAYPDNLRAYLLKIARNAAINRYRRINAEKRGKNASVSFEELAACIADPSGQPGGFEDGELREIINDFLESLKPEMRRVFLLRYWYCAPVKEAAERCGISVSKAESILFRGRKRLKKFLQERGVKV